MKPANVFLLLFAVVVGGATLALALVFWTAPRTPWPGPVAADTAYVRWVSSQVAPSLRKGFSRCMRQAISGLREDSPPLTRQDVDNCVATAKQQRAQALQEAARKASYLQEQRRLLQALQPATGPEKALSSTSNASE